MATVAVVVVEMALGVAGRAEVGTKAVVARAEAEMAKAAREEAVTALASTVLEEAPMVAEAAVAVMTVEKMEVAT